MNMQEFTPKKLIRILIIMTVVVSFLIYIIFSVVTLNGLPSLSKLENPEQELSTRIYSADGQLIGTFSMEQKRIPVTYDKIPKSFVNALVASEDRKFYKHWGTDPDRIIKAVIKRILLGQHSGASTITQQVARNLFLDQSPTMGRKIREAVTAVKIERIYTKEQILEMYANTVHFGRGCFGIAVAAKSYFNKKPMDLTIGESAMLVGILPRPAAYNPFNNLEMALRRRNVVLDCMCDEGYITDGQYAEEVSREIVLNYSDVVNKTPNRKIGDNIAPHFIEMLRQTFGQGEFAERYNIYKDGLAIYSTIDSRIQRYALQAVEEHLIGLQARFNSGWSWSKHSVLLNAVVAKAIGKDPKYLAANTNAEREQISVRLRRSSRWMDSVKTAAATIQCGLVVLDANTGAILAMIGGSPQAMRQNIEADYSLNHAAQIFRQPGSAMKPFVYASALTNGYTPESEVECGPFKYQLWDSTYWTPSGSAECAPGETRTLTSALQASINTVAARLITSVTNPDEVIFIARKAGIKSDLDAVPALSLGAGGDVKPLELISAYSIFVNRGLHYEPYNYNYIEDKKGNVVMKRNKQESIITDAILPEIADQMVYMMERVVNGGTGHVVRTFFTATDAAGKTGTTNDAADAWFIGYTPELVAGVWLGFDDKRITFTCLGGEGYGGYAAAPIWGRLMAKIYKDPSLKYRKKTFDYKKQTYEYGKPYPLTKAQKEFYQDKASVNDSN